MQRCVSKASRALHKSLSKNDIFHRASWYYDTNCNVYNSSISYDMWHFLFSKDLTAGYHGHWSHCHWRYWLYRACAVGVNLFYTKFVAIISFNGGSVTHYNLPQMNHKAMEVSCKNFSYHLPNYHLTSATIEDSFHLRIFHYFNRYFQ